MEQAIELRRKRLRFRSWHRGTKESDLVLGRFADAWLDRFDAAELDDFERLLERSDPDIFDWISGRAAVPPEIESRVTRLLLRFDVSA